MWWQIISLIEITIHTKRKSPFSNYVVFNLGLIIIIVENDLSNYKLFFSTIFQLSTIKFNKYKLKITK